MTRLVIVESPTKAKTIRGFLPKDYRVEACMGHVRDLPADADEIPESVKSKDWARLGVNVDADFEPLYVIPKKKSKVVRELKDALKEADELIVATDEDREGEAKGAGAPHGLPRDHARGYRRRHRQLSKHR
jgi:DNA topoisomerase-1